MAAPAVAATAMAAPAMAARTAAGAGAGASPAAAARLLVDAAVGAAALRPAAAAFLRARRWALHPLIAAVAGPLGRFRAARERRDAASLGQLLWIQGFRTGFGDLFFVASSFCANADFYLLLLPTMIWQGAPKLGRQITYMVTSSLVLGNTIKDIVALPRPPSPPVWRPSAGAALDSSAFADFGFPSTHAMNALSNPLLIVVTLAPWWRKSRARRWGVAAASLAWAGTISFGRMCEFAQADCPKLLDSVSLRSLSTSFVWRCTPDRCSFSRPRGTLAVGHLLGARPWIAGGGVLDPGGATLRRGSHRRRRCRELALGRRGGAVGGAVCAVPGGGDHGGVCAAVGRTSRLVPGLHGGLAV